jgi:hypothetical protein
MCRFGREVWEVTLGPTCTWVGEIDEKDILDSFSDSIVSYCIIPDGRIITK